VGNADGMALRPARAAAVTATFLLGVACRPTDAPFSATDPTFGVEIRTAHGSEAEVKTGRQLLALLGRHDVSPWLVTRSVVIDEDAVSHSHPVLTLSTRHVRDDNLLLASFVHEQLHWFLLAREQQALAALRDLEKLFPDVPVGHPEGANSRSSTYVHLLIGWLEWEALTRLVGTDEANRVIVFWAGDHYRWVYRTVLTERSRLREIVISHGLQV
jgi:hypothetical protein